MELNIILFIVYNQVFMIFNVVFSMNGILFMIEAILCTLYMLVVYDLIIANFYF